MANVIVVVVLTGRQFGSVDGSVPQDWEVRDRRDVDRRRDCELRSSEQAASVPRRTVAYVRARTLAGGQSSMGGVRMRVKPKVRLGASLAAVSLIAAACGGVATEGDGGEELDPSAAEDGGEDDSGEDVEAPEDMDGEPISLGFVSVFSGRVAMLGETGYKGAQLAVEEINEAGGVLDGRPFEISSRDSAADPEQAVRVARDFALQDEVDFIIDGSSSSESFAVSQASSELDTVVLATASEADSLTAPENFQESVFRVARNTQLDGIANALYASELGFETWMGISPDYAYGRDGNLRFFDALEELQPDVEVGTELWPALFEPDYTPLIQQIMDASPDAVYSVLWGGDLVAFIQQAAPFGLFDEVEFFTPNVADSLVLDSVGGDLPAGIHTGSRFAIGSPDTDANSQFDADYREMFGEGPTNWSIQAYVAVKALAQAIEATGGTDKDAITEELKDLQVADSPWGDVQIREEDHTLINYDIRWGLTDPDREEYPVEFTYEADWDTILEMEGLNAS
jgi:branched-chain amino acid transport system substrate-binding protein